MLILVCLLKSFLMLELPSYMLGLLVSVNLLFILSLLLAPGLKMISDPLFMDMIKQKHKHTSVMYKLFFFFVFSCRSENTMDKCKELPVQDLHP